MSLACLSQKARAQSNSMGYVRVQEFGLSQYLELVLAVFIEAGKNR